MSESAETLAQSLKDRFGDSLSACTVDHGEVTVEVPPTGLLDVCTALRDEPDFAFEMLIDLCGVDYLHYGNDEWATEEATGTGFSRGVEAGTSGRMGVVVDTEVRRRPDGKPRFAAVYHLLSVSGNRRLRVRCAPEDDSFPVVDSVTGIWNGADWFEREAFDLYGILFEGHPDLRRLLTDYGFVGHPFRKDFPLSGNVEVRYDAEKRRVVYEPVSIDPRVLVPKVVREDARYVDRAAKGGVGDA